MRIVNNSFYNFYDHAMYLDGVSADYAVISNNTMIECRRPIVAGGVGTVITGNTFKGITQTRFFEHTFLCVTQLIVLFQTIRLMGGVLNFVTGNY